MAKNAQGKMFVSNVTLTPQITFSGAKHPSPDDLNALHHRSHDECFIANSVLTEVSIEPAPPLFVSP